MCLLMIEDNVWCLRTGMAVEGGELASNWRQMALDVGRELSLPVATIKGSQETNSIDVTTSGVIVAMDFVQLHRTTTSVLE
jgi:hypothetical protein